MRRTKTKEDIRALDILIATLPKHVTGMTGSASALP
jgi:hypothetical protein